MTKESAPADFDELVQRLRSRAGRLSPSHAAVAKRVLADPEGVAFMTISELALAVGVHESTIVRFAAALGLDGYPALTQICRNRLRERAQLLRRFDNLDGVGTGEAFALEQALAFDRANISRTFARIDATTWESAVDVLTTAPTVYILGLRKCYAVSYLMGYLLGLVRPGVRTLSLGAGTLLDDLVLVGPGDVFVGIAIHRYTAESVRAFRWASEHGATTIALTDNESSPLARHATLCFYVDTAGTGVLRSMTAFTAVVQALATAVAAGRGAAARSGLMTEESMHDAFGTYARDDLDPTGEF